MSTGTNSMPFPQELINLIIKSAKDDRRTLRNLCLVSKAFLTDAQRFLYMKIGLRGIRVLEDEQDGWVTNVKKDCILFMTLSDNPHLGHYVRDFSYRPDARERREEFWHYFYKALHSMINLKYLRLTLLTGDNALFRTKELCGHPFRLDVLCWKDYRWAMTNHDTEAFLSFLSSQPHLRVLDITSHSLALLTLPSSTCPNLTTFIGSFNLALSVLRGRPITNLVWLGRDPVPSSPLSLFWRKELSKLRVLVFHGNFPHTLDLADFTGSLDCLEALHISFDKRFKVPEPALKKAAELLDHLPSLKKLRMLVWTGITPFGWHDMTLERKRTFGGAAPGFFKLNPSLGVVYFRGSQAPARNRYQRWTRGKVMPIEVGPDDFADLYQSLGFDSALVDRRLIYGL